MNAVLTVRTALMVPLLFSFVSCASLSQDIVTDLSQRDPATRQIIEVFPANNKIFEACLIAWERRNSAWQRVLGPWPAVIGRKGLAPAGEKREGDGRTPSGIYPVGLAFGREVRLKTGLGYRQSTPEDVWVDDVKSVQYNQWIKGVPQADSFEKMLRDDGLYDLGAVIDYNTATLVPGNGSAIFLHIWRDAGRKPTAGCVALRKDRLRRLLSWFEAEKKPQVVLGK